MIAPHPKLRPGIEERLSLPQYAFLWKSVVTAFASEREDGERGYWNYALGLRDSWQSMSKAPAKQVENAVSDIAAMAKSLANRILALSPEIKTLKGYQDIDVHSFMADDLFRFAEALVKPNPPTESMRSRPRSMALGTAERTYMARALTHYILAGTNASDKQIPGRDALVAMTVSAILDIGKDDDFDAKDVSDLTEDIVRHYRREESALNHPAATRAQSKVMGITEQLVRAGESTGILPDAKVQQT